MSKRFRVEAFKIYLKYNKRLPDGRPALKYSNLSALVEKPINSGDFREYNSFIFDSINIEKTDSRPMNPQDSYISETIRHTNCNAKSENLSNEENRFLELMPVYPFKESPNISLDPPTIAFPKFWQEIDSKKRPPRQIPGKLKKQLSREDSDQPATQALPSPERPTSRPIMRPSDLARKHSSNPLPFTSFDPTMDLPFHFSERRSSYSHASQSMNPQQEQSPNSHVTPSMHPYGRQTSLSDAEESMHLSNRQSMHSHKSESKHPRERRLLTPISEKSINLSERQSSLSQATCSTHSSGRQASHSVVERASHSCSAATQTSPTASEKDSPPRRGKLAQVHHCTCL
ncbi:hypothetical protein NPIL_675691 [Nephila pilipes]|uniref:Uncharacterized protein n=1 Tax=Nephila pilipes TaxID=299642 RepID=A0A8X6MW70_NEPPI|nr:hypothetical protein NPIL_675691 [Nephila pilipes]